MRIHRSFVRKLSWVDAMLINIELDSTCVKGRMRSNTEIPQSYSNRKNIDKDHYLEYKDENLFYQKKLSKRESKKVEKIAKDQYEIIINFMTEILYYLLSHSENKSYFSSLFSSSQEVLEYSIRGTNNSNDGDVPTGTLINQNLLIKGIKHLISISFKSKTNQEGMETPKKHIVNSSDSESSSEEEDSVDSDRYIENSAQIKKFVEKCLTVIPVDPRILVVGLIYFDKFLNARKNSRRKNSTSPVDINTYERYLAVCIALASKVWEDRFYSNLSLFKLFDFENVQFKEFNTAEIDVLCALNFELHLTYDVFRKYIHHYSHALGDRLVRVKKRDEQD